MRYALSILILLAGVNLHAASFDCTQKLNQIEKMICVNSSVSALDEQLSELYKAVKKADQHPYLIQERQRQWLRNERRTCQDEKCLLQTYQSRIAYLHKVRDKQLKQPKRHFRISQNYGGPLCQAYLNVLNSQPINEIKVCELPSLADTAITPVEFVPLVGDRLKEIDQIIWEQQCPQRKKKYAMGYRKLGEAYWDLDKDGELDQIIKKSAPSYLCEDLAEEEAVLMNDARKAKWATLSVSEQLKSARSVGHLSFLNLIKNGRLSLVTGGHFVTYQGRYISIEQNSMSRKNVTNNWIHKEWVKIIGINPVEDGRNFRSSGSICKFEYIK